MKKNFFPVALMALAIGFNACSSDDVTVNANGGVSSPVLEGGYVKMAINMPSQVSGRADEVKNDSKNDHFDDGLAKEYDVKNATLLLFAGSDKKDATEDDAIFHSAYKLDVSMAKEGAQITSTTRIVKPVNDEAYKDKKKLYAYVVLNNNNLVTIETPTKLKLNLKNKIVGPDGSETVSGVTEMDKTTTFESFRKYIAEGGESVFHANGFLMNNAPLYDKTSTKVQTLVPITDEVYQTKEAAEAADASEVFVERALAKVTMQSEVTNSTLSAADAVIVQKADGTLNKTFSIEGWTLDVTNKTSYLGRSYDNSWNSFTPTRFIGTTKLRENGLEHEGTSLYRTYWGEDPNYSSSKATDFNILTKDDFNAAENLTKPVNLVSNGFGNYNPLYCMENTLNVEQMENGSQVTRAIVKVKFLNGTTFYTFNDDNTTLYTQEKMIDRVKQAILDNTAVFNKCEEVFKGDIVNISKNDVQITWTSQVANPEGSTTSFDPKRDKEGKIYLKSFKITKGSEKVESSDVFGTTENLNGQLQLQFGNIMQYADGLAYYAIPIKHFGQDLTPWHSTDAGVTTSTSYNNDNKYLGRYGVLRNNWYDIAVSGIKYVGSPVVPEITFGPGNTPDKVENYIAVRINVLSWAKRTQVEEL